VPYEISLLGSNSGKASDILYATWTYEVTTRYVDRTFVAWDRDLDNDGTDEPEENWLAIYDSPCDGHLCANCSDINQVELIITVEYTP
jgi:hypothetical protein